MSEEAVKQEAVKPANPKLDGLVEELSKLTVMEAADLSKILEETMLREKNIKPNLDFPAGPTYYLMGFDIDFFTPIFIVSRITGWAAHVMEQFDSNKLIRPLSKYTGAPHRQIEK